VVSESDALPASGATVKTEISQHSNVVQIQSVSCLKNIYVSTESQLYTINGILLPGITFKKNPTDMLLQNLQWEDHLR